MDFKHQTQFFTRSVEKKKKIPEMASYQTLKNHHLAIRMQLRNPRQFWGSCSRTCLSYHTQLVFTLSRPSLAFHTAVFFPCCLSSSL